MMVRDRPLTIGRALRQIPWLAGVLALYVIVVLVDSTGLRGELFAVTLPSGGVWTFFIGDLVVLLGLIALFAEILKATRTSRVSVADHALSMLTFVVCLLLFLLWSGAATSIFFLIMWLTVIDVIAGFTVSLAGARRDIGLAAGDQM
ncbi:MAG TPA: hypothetical protein VJL84_10350 [Kiloniellales bacterium]|nr:hypothetical protein [Kiloniellales bacterium]